MTRTPAPSSSDERYWHPERDRTNRKRPPRYIVGPHPLAGAGATLVQARTLSAAVDELAHHPQAVLGVALILDRRTGLYVDADGKSLDPQPDGAPVRKRT